VAGESRVTEQAALAAEDQRQLPSLALRRRRRSGSRLLARLTAGGTEGNERLTTVTGALLLVLLAVLGVTILRIRPLLEVHMFLGVLLIGPLALKMASTGYRFMRYYTSEPHYRRKGPPAMALRLMAPVVVLSTLVVFASGVALMLVGPSSRGALLPVHKISFIVWLIFISLHVLGHLPELSRVLRPQGASLAGLDDRYPGRSAINLALGGALVAGLVLGILAIPQFGPWMHTHFLHH